MCLGEILKLLAYFGCFLTMAVLEFEARPADSITVWEAGLMKIEGS